MVSLFQPIPTVPPSTRKSRRRLDHLAVVIVLRSLSDSQPSFHSFQPSMIGMAVWSSWTPTHSVVPSTQVFCRNQPRRRYCPA